MLGKAVCLCVVLIIAAHAADTYADTTSESLAVADVGPESMVSLAETGSSLTRRHLDSFALDKVDFHDDMDALRQYEEDAEERKERRRARRARRRAARRARREEQRLANEAEMDKEERARAKARHYRKKKEKRAAQKKKAAAEAKKPKKIVKRPSKMKLSKEQKRKLRANETNEQRKIRKKIEHNRKLKKRDLKLLKEARKYEKKVAYHNARAKEFEKKAAYEAASKSQHKTRSKWAKRDRSTAYAVRAGTSKVSALQGQLETEDLRADQRFWDAYYGVKKNKGVSVKKGHKKHKSLAAMAADLKKKGKKGQKAKEHATKPIDRSLALYNASHIASYAEAYGQGKIKELDSNLKEDGDAYIKFFQELN